MDKKEQIANLKRELNSRLISKCDCCNKDLENVEDLLIKPLVSQLLQTQELLEVGFWFGGKNRQKISEEVKDFCKKAIEAVFDN